MADTDDNRKRGTLVGIGMIALGALGAVVAGTIGADRIGGEARRR